MTMDGSYGRDRDLRLGLADRQLALDDTIQGEFLAGFGVQS